MVTENSLVGKVPYWELIGSLLYLSGATDTFAVNDLSRFNDKHTLKIIYLSSITKLFIFFIFLIENKRLPHFVKIYPKSHQYLNFLLWFFNVRSKIDTGTDED